MRESLAVVVRLLRLSGSLRELWDRAAAFLGWRFGRNLCMVITLNILTVGCSLSVLLTVKSACQVRSLLGLPKGLKARL